MIDGNLLQTAQGSFDFEGRVAAKLMVNTCSFLLKLLAADQKTTGNSILIEGGDYFKYCLLKVPMC